MVPDNIQGIHTDIRPEKETAKWRKKDPITNFEKYLIKNGVFREESLEKIKQKIKKEIKEAHTFAKISPYPKKREINKYVFKK